MSAGSTAAMAGATVAMETAIIAEQEEEDEQRRKSHMGNDQLLIETTLSVDTVGEKVASVFKNWYYKDYNICRKRNSKFDFGMAFLCLFLSMIIFATMFILLWVFNIFSTDINTSIFISIAVSIIIAIICGIESAKTDDVVDWINISQSKNGNARILIKIYTSDGYRNINEDDLQDIKDVLK